MIVNVRDRLSTRLARTQDIWSMAAEGGDSAQPVLARSFAERDARLSPDGRFMAYVSDESGQPEVSIQRLFPTPARTVISVGGGEQPVWRRDQSELFYVDLDGRLCSVAVRSSSATELTVGMPTFPNVPPIGTGHWGTQYDVSPNGQRIYFLDRRQNDAPRAMDVILDWSSLLQ